MSHEASLADVPSDIMIDIFSRIPVKTIISCKSVCKSWLNLLTSPKFVESHLSKSKLPGLVFSINENNRNIPSLYHVIEFESYSTITVFDLMKFTGCCEETYMAIQGSVNGLIFCRMRTYHSYSYYICNPITREYIELPPPKGGAFPYYECCGFGVSKMNGLYKMVRISSCNYKHDHLMCEVYTLGTRSWRTVPLAPDAPPLKYRFYTTGAFLNGSLHWLAADFEDHWWIFCFDLETKLFSTFSTPVGSLEWELMASGDCLRLIHYGYDFHDTVVWSMKEYGVGESWTKECVISRTWYSDGHSYTGFGVINVYSNGDVLIELCRWCLLYYSSKTKTGRVMCTLELPKRESSYTGMLHSPSFLSLRSLALEDVKLF